MKYLAIHEKKHSMGVPGYAVFRKPLYKHEQKAISYLVGNVSCPTLKNSTETMCLVTLYLHEIGQLLSVTICVAAHKFLYG